jgi:hypothetical protein
LETRVKFRGKGRDRQGEKILTPLLDKISPLVVRLGQQLQEVLVVLATVDVLSLPDLFGADAITSEHLVAEVEVLDARVVAQWV